MLFLCLHSIFWGTFNLGGKLSAEGFRAYYFECNYTRRFTLLQPLYLTFTTFPLLLPLLPNFVFSDLVIALILVSDLGWKFLELSLGFVFECLTRFRFKFSFRFLAKFWLIRGYVVGTYTVNLGEKLWGEAVNVKSMKWWCE